MNVNLSFYRLKLKAKLRHLRRSPGDVDPQSIESERVELTALFVQLKQMQQAAGVAEPNAAIVTSSSTVDPWDDLAFDPILSDDDPVLPDTRPVHTPADNNHQTSTGGHPIEDQTITMCSNGNTSVNYRNLEIKHRTLMAEDQLSHIRNLIAEKSFQFSHVIRVSPRKSVTTRARAAVKKLNNQIAEHCRCYARCRSSLMILGADQSILSKFNILNPVDIVGSTAILKPNDPGSTKIKLSWIWQSSASHILTYTGQTQDELADAISYMADDAPRLLECMLMFYCFILNLIHLVRRVHWLRARAQLMRWQEEVTLTTYEMQWTVRYFIHKSKFWSDVQTIPASTSNTPANIQFDVAGCHAYSKRKYWTWHQLAIKADNTFKVINNAYKSPL